MPPVPPGVGTLGVAAAFSFYGNKNMTTAEGGAILAGDEKLRDGIRRARGHGLTSGTFQRRSGKNPICDVTMLGFNYRMDELRAATASFNPVTSSAGTRSEKTLRTSIGARSKPDAPL